MERYELRLVGPRHGVGFLWIPGQPTARVAYDLQEYELAPLTADESDRQPVANQRIIQGSLRQLDDVSLVDQEEVILHLVDGSELTFQILRLARKAYGRPVYTVRHPPR